MIGNDLADTENQAKISFSERDCSAIAGILIYFVIMCATLEYTISDE